MVHRWYLFGMKYRAPLNTVLLKLVCNHIYCNGKTIFSYHILTKAKFSVLGLSSSRRADRCVRQLRESAPPPRPARLPLLTMAPPPRHSHSPHPAKFNCIAVKLLIIWNTPPPPQTELAGWAGRVGGELLLLPTHSLWRKSFGWDFYQEDFLYLYPATATWMFKSPIFPLGWISWLGLPGTDTPGTNVGERDSVVEPKMAIEGSEKVKRMSREVVLSRVRPSESLIVATSLKSL